jgi:hypothetical protein
VAAVLALAVIAGMALLFRWDPDVAGRLAAEDHLLEWAQVGLLLAAAVLGARGALAGAPAWRPRPPGVLLTVGLVGILMGEVDLDRRLFGVKVVATRFLFDGRVWLPFRVLVGAVLAAVPMALGWYALRRRADLVAALARLARAPSGQVLLAGVLLFALTEALEAPLGHLPWLPRYVAEEPLELVAGIWVLLGLVGGPDPD